MYSKAFSILKDDEDYQPHDKWEQFKEDDAAWMRLIYNYHKNKHSKIDHPLGYRTSEAFACSSCTKKARQGRNKIMTPIIRKIGSIIKKLVNESNKVISVDYSKTKYIDTQSFGSPHNWKLGDRNTVHEYKWIIQGEKPIIQIKLIIYDDYFKGDDIIKRQNFYIYGRNPSKELPLQREGPTDIILNPNFEISLHNETYRATRYKYKPALVIASEERSLKLLKSVVDENPNASIGKVVYVKNQGDYNSGYWKETVINNALIIHLDWPFDLTDFIEQSEETNHIRSSKKFIVYDLDRTSKGSITFCVHNTYSMSETDFYLMQEKAIKLERSRLDAERASPDEFISHPLTPIKNTNELINGDVIVYVSDVCLSPNTNQAFKDYPLNDFLATMVLMSRNRKDWESMW